MRNNRIGYIILILILLVMLYMTGQPFLVYAIIILLLTALLMLVLLLIDSSNISACLNIAGRAKFGQELTYVLSIDSRHGIHVIRNVIVDLEIYNKMFGSTSYKTLMFELSGGRKECRVTLPAIQCGEIVLKCRSIHIVDMMRLFKIRTKPFKDAGTIIYPKRVGISVELSEVIRGESVKEGAMQNRKGSDSSEIYDIREYRSGDDARSIHWKLSEKIDKLVIRESSEPSHYDAVIIPDFAHYNGEKEVTLDELNTAIAITAEIAEQLLMKGIHFCVMIPWEQGLNEIYVSGSDDFEKMLEQCMCFKILEYAGSGLEYFITEHKEQDYTRMIIISAGRYGQNLMGLEKHLGITIVNAVDSIDKLFIDAHDGLEIIDIPASKDATGKYHIVC